MPDRAPTPERVPTADVRVAPQTMCVTIHLPQLALSTAEIVVTRSSVRFRCRKASKEAEVLVPLPVTAQPGRFVARERNGVFDVLIERGNRSH